MQPSTLVDAGPVFDAYLCAMRQIFAKEAWQDVEPYAARVWNECRMDCDPEWQAIRAQAAAAWAA